MRKMHLDGDADFYVGDTVHDVKRQKCWLPRHSRPGMESREHTRCCLQMWRVATGGGESKQQPDSLILLPAMTWPTSARLYSRRQDDSSDTLRNNLQDVFLLFF